MRKKAFSKQSGFTLIELVIVLGIVSILSVAVGLSWPGQTFVLRAQVDQLVQDMRYAQSRAMTTEQRVRVNLTATSYWLTDRPGTTGIIIPGKGNTDPVLLDSSVSLSSAQSFIIFDELGMPYTSAALPGTPLASNLTITLSSNGESQSITVIPETGRVSAL